MRTAEEVLAEIVALNETERTWLAWHLLGEKGPFSLYMLTDGNFIATTIDKYMKELIESVTSRLELNRILSKRRSLKNGSPERLKAIRDAAKPNGTIDWKKACNNAKIDYESASELSALKQLWKRNKKRGQTS